MPCHRDRISSSSGYSLYLFFFSGGFLMTNNCLYISHTTLILLPWGYWTSPVFWQTSPFLWIRQTSLVTLDRSTYPCQTLFCVSTQGVLTSLLSRTSVSLFVLVFSVCLILDSKVVTRWMIHVRNVSYAFCVWGVTKDSCTTVWRQNFLRKVSTHFRVIREVKGNQTEDLGEWWYRELRRREVLCFIDILSTECFLLVWVTLD